MDAGERCLDELAKSVFLDALKIGSGEDRLAYLDRRCGEDADLRAEVETLLRHHDGLGDYLERPAFGPNVTEELSVPAPESSGVSIGPYKLLEQIGEGGMGTIWMAQQTEPVKRLVAVKLIKAGMDSKQVIARFEAERQALALMDHTNIARVLDAGTTQNGRPYFVMDLVKGVPITKYCDEHHLTPRERLELFLPVCQAIQHAHQKGIIHRDLKPSNVLVALYDGKPVPKVIDFGVAKAAGQSLTDKTLVTGFGNIVGTMEYMSPEQAEINQLDIDTRSDIYSLGVLLYELLTGTTPFTMKDLEKAGMLEMLRVIREQEPTKPSTRLSTAEGLPTLAANRGTEPARLTKLVRGELDWIVMKCLEKDRNRRYETANGVMRDIERYLYDEPVTAGPPSAWYRLRKFSRRNRAAVLTVAAILFVLVAGIAGTTFGLIRAERRRAEAEQARSDEATQRRIADAEKQRAEEAERQTLASYRASADDAIEQLIGAKPDLGPQEKTYLKTTLERWQAFAARQGDDERGQALRAEGHHRVALLWSRLGRQDEARTEYETARDLRQKLAAAFPAVPQYQQDLAQTHNNLGLQLARRSQIDAARTECQTARDLFQKLVAAFPAVPDYQERLANAHYNVGRLLLKGLGQSDAARTEYETARDLQQKLAKAFPAVPAYQQDLANTHCELGILLAGLGQIDAARIEYETARDLEQKLAAAFPAVPAYQMDLAHTHGNLGQLLARLGQSDAARTEYETARDLRQKVAAAFPAVPTYQLELAQAHGDLGILLAGLGQIDAARTEYETARDLEQKLAAAFPAVPTYQTVLARTHGDLGRLLARLGQSDAARKEYETARDLQQKLAAAFPAVPSYQQALATTHNSLGILLSGLGQRDAARIEYETARDLQQKLVAASPAVPDYQQALANTHNSLGILLAELGQSDAARTEYQVALDLQQKLAAAYPAVPAYRSSLAFIHSRLGNLLDELGQRDAARTEYETARDLQQKLAAAFPAAPEHQHALANTHNNLGILLRSLGQSDAARTEYQTAFDLLQKLAAAFPAVPGYRVSLGGSYDSFAKLILDGGQPHDSLHWFDLAIRTLTPVYENNRREVQARRFLRNSHWGRALAYDQLKKHAEAIDDWGKAIELSPGPKQPELRASRTLSRLRAGQAAEAIAEVQELTKTARSSVSLLYSSACIYAVASTRIADKKHEYADRAMEVLRQAVKAGFQDAAHLKKDTDLDPLRGREDFLKLLAELEARAKQPEK